MTPEERARKIVTEFEGLSAEGYDLDAGEGFVEQEIRAAEAAAYQRGAEAMREAVAMEFEKDGLLPRTTQAIRALPIPPDSGESERVNE